MPPLAACCECHLAGWVSPVGSRSVPRNGSTIPTPGQIVSFTDTWKCWWATQMHLMKFKLVSHSTRPELNLPNALGHSKLSSVKKNVPSGVRAEWKETKHLMKIDYIFKFYKDLWSHKHISFGALQGAFTNEVSWCSRLINIRAKSPLKRQIGNLSGWAKTPQWFWTWSQILKDKEIFFRRPVGMARPSRRCQ